MGENMNDMHTNPEQSATFYANEGGNGLDLIWGILDRSRKYVVEVRPMFLRGNVPVVISFARDKHCLAALAQNACMVMFFEASGWPDAFAKDNTHAAERTDIVTETLKSADVAIVAFALTDNRTMVVKSCRYDCARPTIPNEA